MTIKYVRAIKILFCLLVVSGTCLLASCTHVSHKAKVLEEKISLQYAGAPTREMFGDLQNFLDAKEWKLDIKLCDYEKQKTVDIYTVKDTFLDTISEITRYLEYDLGINESQKKIIITSKQSPGCSKPTKLTEVEGGQKLLLLSKKYAANLGGDPSFHESTVNYQNDVPVKSIGFVKGTSFCTVLKTLAKYQQDLKIVTARDNCTHLWLATDYSAKGKSWNAVLNDLLGGPINHSFRRTTFGDLKDEMLIPAVIKLPNFEFVRVFNIKEDVKRTQVGNTVISDCAALQNLQSQLGKHGLKIETEFCDKNRHLLIGSNVENLSKYFFFMLFSVHSDIRIDKDKMLIVGK